MCKQVPSLVYNVYFSNIITVQDTIMLCTPLESIFQGDLTHFCIKSN